MGTPKKPDARLLSAVPYLRPGASVVDVGADHAYLPVFLLREGLAARALACDVNAGPLARARKNIAEAGLSERIGTLLTDGLHGVEPFAPDHVLVFGMGGELIARILSEAAWIRHPGIRLILQPMTRAQVLRGWLWENGFGTVGERLTAADGRVYQTICAEWTGRPTPFTPVDALVGKPEFLAADPLCPVFLEREIRTRKKILRGKATGNRTDPTEEDLLRALEERLRGIGENA